jgi:putative MATE family efflux protein
MSRPDDALARIAPEPPEPAPPALPVEAPAPGFWASVREALRGSEQDFARAPLRRAILLLAVPMVLEMALESVFAVTDVFFVSRLGAAAVATVGLTESLLTLVYALAMGLGIGATAVVARRVGERDREGAARAAVQAVALALLVSAVLGVAGALLAPRLLALMGASPEVLATGTTYARIMLGGEATIVVLFVANAAFRGAGDAAIAMRVLWIANAINIVLGPLLIFGPGPFPALGVAAPATATTIGRGTGAVYALWRLLGPGGRLPVERRHLALSPAMMVSIARLSAGGTVQTLIGTASWIGLVRIVSTFGSAALAGYTIGMRVVIFALLPLFGLSNAAATLVGQALGAKDPARAEEAVWVTARYAAWALGVVGAAFLLLAPAIVGIFTRDPAVHPHGVACLRIVASGFVFYAYGMVLTQAFNGAGDTRTPTVLNVIVFWLWEIPLAWVLAVPLGMGPTGVFVAVAISFSTLAVVSGVLFKRGAWKRVRV